jgi:ABC-type sugar transport system substrate-binding protein
MKQLLSLGLILWVSAANAQNAPATATATQDQGQARQFGILVGGTATQHDLCVKKGFLAKSDQSAEETAKSIFDKMHTIGGPDQSAYIQDGWDMIKKEISAHESFYTQEKCTGVAKEWAKIVATTRKK